MTHTFLTREDIDSIAGFVPDAIAEIPVLLVSETDDGILGFAGVDGTKLEMLFLAPEARGRGIGRQMVDFMIVNYGISELCVNEQNPQAKGFYEHMGFEVYKREPLDEQGNPFPILYMRLGA